MKFIQPALCFAVICALLIMPTTLAARDQAVNVPAGTIVHVRMIDSINSDRNSVGQTFRASLDSPIRVRNRTVIPRGAAARVQLVGARSAGRVKGRSRLNLQLVSIRSGNQNYIVHSDVIGFRGKSESKQTARNAGIGAAVGGGVGALLGGGRGAAVGAGLGAGTGVAANAAHRGQQVRIGSESRLQFRLRAPLYVR